MREAGADNLIEGVATPDLWPVPVPLPAWAGNASSYWLTTSGQQSVYYPSGAEKVRGWGVELPAYTGTAGITINAEIQRAAGIGTGTAAFEVDWNFIEPNIAQAALTTAFANPDLGAIDTGTSVPFVLTTIAHEDVNLNSRRLALAIRRMAVDPFSSSAYMTRVWLDLAT